MTPDQVLLVERHRAVWEALAAAGFGTRRSGPVLETGHHLDVYFDQREGQWFARARDLSGWLPPRPYLMWLGADDEAVPGRLREELAKPEAVTYLRASMD